MQLSALARAFVRVVAVVGIGAGAVGIGLGAPRGFGNPVELGILALVYSLSWAYPLLVVRGDDAEGVHVDEAFLVVMLLLAPPSGALTVFIAVPLLVQVVRRVDPVKLMFNVGQIALATSAAAGAAQLLGHVGPGVSPERVGAVVVGALVFFVVNGALVAGIITLTDEDTGFFAAFGDGLAFNCLVWVGTASLGVLTALATEAFSWALVLAVLPLAVLNAILRHSLELRGERERIDGLLKAALDAHGSVRSADVEEALVRTSRELVGAREAEIRSTAPDDDELGAQLTGQERRWLVVSGKRGLDQFTTADHRALEALATIAAGALDNARLVDEIHHQAFHDSLTGLANRVLFEERLHFAVAAANRKDERVAVMFLDLDNFKKINDSLGHGAGNDLLAQVAIRLNEVVRDTDTVARNGGDEFTILLTGLESSGDASIVAEHLLDSFKHPFVLEGHEVFITPSIGLAVYPNHAEDGSALLKQADMAMYRAKQRGRNTFAVWSEGLASSTYQRLTLEASLHQAVERQEFAVLYQPKVNSVTRRIEGVEALVRWPHPEMGMVSPAQFIPLAEETGLIRPIDMWVLVESCRQAVRWVKQGLTPTSVAVNLSGRDFQNPHLVETIRAAIEETGVPPELLELEITEGVAIDFSDTGNVFNELKELGCTLAIDDFGTGYSILSRLQRLPIDVLKIDKSFVDAIDREDADAPIVDSLIRMGHGLGMKVVAEGVEEAHQWSWLEARDCDLIQGWFFARPAPADEITEMLRLQEAPLEVVSTAGSARIGAR